MKTSHNPIHEPCDECGEMIDPGMSACPACGNEPVKAAKRSAYILIAGGILCSLTVVGAIIGIPLMLVGIWTLTSILTGIADYSPTEHSFESPF